MFLSGGIFGWGKDKNTPIKTKKYRNSLVDDLGRQLINLVTTCHPGHSYLVGFFHLLVKAEELS